MVLLARLRHIHHLLLRQNVVCCPRSLLLQHTVSASHLSTIILTSCWCVRSILAVNHAILGENLLRLSDGRLRISRLLLNLTHVLLGGTSILCLLSLSTVLELLQLLLTLHVW